MKVLPLQEIANVLPINPLPHVSCRKLRGPLTATFLPSVEIEKHLKQTSYTASISALLVPSRSRCILTRLTGHGLHPDLLGNLDAVALMVGVTAREVAVGEQLAGHVAAGETEFFPVAHAAGLRFLFSAPLFVSAQSFREFVQGRGRMGGGSLWSGAVELSLVYVMDTSGNAE